MSLPVVWYALALAVPVDPAGPPRPVAPAAKPVAADRVPGCPATPPENGDVVVCGRKDRDAQYRLPPLTHRFDPVPGPGVGVKVGAGRANAYVTQQASPDGKPDKRVMVTWTMPF